MKVVRAHEQEGGAADGLEERPRRGEPDEAHEHRRECGDEEKRKAAADTEGKGEHDAEAGIRLGGRDGDGATLMPPRR